MVIRAASNSSRLIAVVGNPNTGKSTLFNALAGMSQRVGNYPGVTVQKKTGRLQYDGPRIDLVDLPGTYSLAARSADELIAVELLVRGDAGRLPDAILCVVDANNLERNLFLVQQVAALGLPMLVALNMTDVARRNGLTIEIDELSRRLRMPVVAVQGNRRLGIAALKAQLAGLADRPPPPQERGILPPALDDEAEQLATELPGGRTPRNRFLAERLLLDASGLFARRFLPAADGQAPPLVARIAEARQRLEASGTRLGAAESLARYARIERCLEGIVHRPKTRSQTFSDRLDSLLTHRLWGTAVLAALMLVVFQAVFAGATPLMEWIEAGVQAISRVIVAAMPAGAFRSLLVDGVLAGAGGVLAFLPQILILFAFIGILEDCGYLARASYLMDRWMTRVGLSGKSFIPLLSSFACAIPGVMATRIIENPRDRLVTILVAPLMSCSARLPVYTLLISTFVPQYTLVGGLVSTQSLTLFACYTLGVVSSIAVAWLLRRTILRGEAPPFVMELPEYKFPSLEIVARRMLERGWAFVARAGTVIVAVAIVVWAASYYPRTNASSPANAAAPSNAEIASLSPAEQMRHSYLGRVGRAIEPVTRPLGWDWRIASAVVASFPAREVVVASLAVIYSLGDDSEDDEATLRTRLRQARWDGTDRPVFSLPVALSLLAFFALCAQCASTLVIIGRETNSWRWPLFAFVYMTLLAYAAAWLAFHTARLFGEALP